MSLSAITDEIDQVSSRDFPSSAYPPVALERACLKQCPYLGRCYAEGTRSFAFRYPIDIANQTRTTGFRRGDL